MDERRTTVMSHAWGYLDLGSPVALLVLGYLNRQRRPLIWLGALLFVTFLLPTLGLAPFAYQAYSTVADRYAYLALLGVGLMVSDTFDQTRRQKLAMRRRRDGVHRARRAVVQPESATGSPARTFSTTPSTSTRPRASPTTIWVTRRSANGDLATALADYQACVAHDPTRVKAHINLAEVYTALDQPAEAERAIAEAEQAPDMTPDDFSNLGIVLMKMNQPARALQALATAVAMDPAPRATSSTRPTPWPRSASSTQAEAAFRRCIALAPTLAAPTPVSASCSPRPAASPRPSLNSAQRFACNQTIRPPSTI